jgi:hypothetical protein
MRFASAVHQLPSCVRNLRYNRSRVELAISSKYKKVHVLPYGGAWVRRVGERVT